MNEEASKLADFTKIP